MHAVYESIRQGLDELGFETVIDRNIESGLVVSVKYPDDPNWDFDLVHDYCYGHGKMIANKTNLLIQCCYLM